MKYRIILSCLLLLLNGALTAQHVGISVTAGVRKTWAITKKAGFDLRQQIQINPEIKKFESDYGDIFNEEGFWPIPDRDDDDGDDDDDGGVNNPPIDPGTPELNDDPYTVSFEWRTSSVGRLQYNFFEWLRLSSGYTLFYNGEEFRHAWQSELDYRPLLHNDRKRKFDISTRMVFQRTGRPRKSGGMKWESFLTPRFQLTYKMDKKHTFYAGSSLNGAWDDNILEFERYRLNGGIQFTFNKKHLFDLGYQFQKRLDKPDRSNSVSLSYTVRL
jgi:hypothetical protein